MNTILSVLASRAHWQGENTALIQHQRNGAQSLSYAQLDALSDHLAAWLQAQGIGGGQLIGLYLRKCPEQVAAMLAILKIGCAFYSLNPKLSLHQIDYIAGLSHSPLLLADNAALMRLGKLEAGQLAATRVLHFSSEKLTPIHNSLLQKLTDKVRIERLAPEDLAAARPEPVTVVGSDPALALFTSGSTGQPKGVLISQQDIVWRMQGESAAYQLSAADRLLSLLPFSFDVGLSQLYSSLYSGSTLVILNSWMPQDILAALADYQISGLSSVPSLWADMLAKIDPETLSATLDKLRYGTISGGDMPPAQLERLGELAGKMGIYKTYGQTETFRSSMLLPADYARKKTSIGRPIPGTEVFILSEDGSRAAVGESGEIVHRGNGTMLGYINDASASAAKLRPHPLNTQPETFPQQAVLTGDIGRFDEDGFLYILGRRDHMLKVQGNRVYPKEIQDVLQEHPSVQEAAVIGIKQADGDAKLHAEVLLKPGASFDALALNQFLMQNLPSYMLPGTLNAVEDFPRTASGKIQFAAIEEKYRDQG